MPVTAPFRFRAFLSYSHRDGQAGEKLHKRLEGYRVPAELVGKAGRFGPVPEKLRPIFRDRFDLEAGHSLREQVLTALKESEALVVVCSSHSAKSPYVNEEIRLFKAMGRGDRIYPIIIDGEPGDPRHECFPASLTRRVAQDGTLTDEIEEPLAADMRPHGDGPELAELKLMAGLLGVDLDELRKREEIENRRRLRRSRALAAAMAFLALFATAGAVVAGFALKERNVALQNESAARKLAEDKHREAEQRYSQALNSTLRLVTTAATLRAVLEDTSFGISQIEAKGESDDFQEFLRTAQRPEEVWLRLVKVLMSYEHNLPPELRRFRDRLLDANMPLQWARHAETIMMNLMVRGSDEPRYKEQLVEVRSKIAALGGQPRKDCRDVPGGSRPAPIPPPDSQVLRDSPMAQTAVIAPTLPLCE